MARPLLQLAEVLYSCRQGLNVSRVVLDASSGACETGESNVDKYSLFHTYLPYQRILVYKVDSDGPWVLGRVGSNRCLLAR